MDSRSLYWGVWPHWLAVLTINRTLPRKRARSTSLPSISLTRKSRTEAGFLGASWAETMARAVQAREAVRTARAGSKSDRSNTVGFLCVVQWGRDGAGLPGGRDLPAEGAGRSHSTRRDQDP